MMLENILAKKKRYLEMVKDFVSLEEITAHARRLTRQPLSFETALKGGLAIIGEIKKASPSHGVIRPDFYPAELAHGYCNADVQAISVVTETDYFKGSPRHLQEARRVSHLPILRKDFIIDEYQIYESYVMGADAIFLMAKILPDDQLARFKALAEQFGMTCLLEVHTEDEIRRGVDLGFYMFDISNRNMNTWAEDLRVTAVLSNKVPGGKLIISEGGIHTPADVVLMRNCGVNAVMMGEAFMQARNIPLAVAKMRSGL